MRIPGSRLFDLSASCSDRRFRIRGVVACALTNTRAWRSGDSGVVMDILKTARQCCRGLLAFALASGCMACGEDRVTGPSPPSTSPSPSPPSPSPPTRAVRGTVFEHTPSGVRPLEGVPLRVFKGAGDRPEVVDVTSGADGSYEVGVTEWPSFVRVHVAPDSPYRAPCPPYAWAEQRLDVHVVAGAILSATGIPPSFPTNSIPASSNFYFRVLGVVTERTSGGVKPLPGATVALLNGAPGESGDDAHWADTFTDANGRYLLCWVGHSEVSGYVQTQKEGYARVSQYGAPYWGDWSLDFELTRR